MKTAPLMRLVCILWLALYSLNLSGCGAKPSLSEGESEKAARESQEQSAAQRKQIEGLQRTLADQQKHIEELQSTLADQQRRTEDQQKQVEALQRQTANLQKPPTTTHRASPVTTDVRNLPTTTELRRAVVGMTKGELLNWLGKPVATSDDGDTLYWHYDNVAKDPDAGMAMQAQVVIENGKVDHVNFH